MRVTGLVNDSATQYGENTHTVYCHEDEFFPEENHSELLLRQTEHFESYMEACRFAERWDSLIGPAIIVEYGKDCTCPFCPRS